MRVISEIISIYPDIYDVQLISHNSICFMDDNNASEKKQLILGKYLKQWLIEEDHKFKKYVIKDVFGGQRVEIKTQKISESKPSVLHEAGFLQQMQGYPGFPLMIWSGNFTQNQMGLITEKLGYNLMQLMKITPQQHFSLATVCKIGIQIIKILQMLHDKHTILDNIRPQIFRIDSLRVDQLMVSSLLNCKRYRFYKNQQHYKLKKMQYLDFFDSFVSYNKLAHLSTSRRDDLQSFFFLLVFLRKGELPWSKIQTEFQDETRILLYKAYHSLFTDDKSRIREQLLSGLPHEFRLIFKHICQLQFQEKPSYCYIRMKLKRVLAFQEKLAESFMDWIPYLPLLSKQSLVSAQIEYFQLMDVKSEKQIYQPFSHKVQIDNFYGVGVSHSNRLQSNSQVLKRKQLHNKSHCQLI